MKRKILIFLLAGVLLGIAGSKWYSVSQRDAVVTKSLETNNSVSNTVPSTDKKTENIPSKVYEILKYVETFHQPKEGYLGGGVFHNYEELLPKYRPNGNPIKYREWDVNPNNGILKRGKERLITGDNKSAWYTHDHYKSFIKIH